MVDVSFCIFKGQKGQAVCFKGQEKKVRNKKKLDIEAGTQEQQLKLVK